jgi:hypothetical protein
MRCSTNLEKRSLQTMITIIITGTFPRFCKLMHTTVPTFYLIITHTLLKNRTALPQIHENVWHNVVIADYFPMTLTFDSSVHKRTAWEIHHPLRDG